MSYKKEDPYEEIEDDLKEIAAVFAKDYANPKDAERDLTKALDKLNAKEKTKKANRLAKLSSEKALDSYIADYHKEFDQEALTLTRQDMKWLVKYFYKKFAD